MTALDKLFDALKNKMITESQFEHIVENAEYQYWIREYCEI